MVVVSVLVPEERVAEFYVAVGRWYEQGSQAVGAQDTKPAARTPVRRGPGRYAPLTEFLSRARGGAKELSFAELEDVLGAELPASARKFRAFWANSVQTTQARGWLDADWSVAWVDMEGERVRFERS